MAVKTNDCLKRSVKMGNDTPATSDDKETIFEIIKTTSQVTMTSARIIRKAAIWVARPINTPKVVAIPLPPLKRRKIVQLCPEIQLMPKRMRKASKEIPEKRLATKFPTKTTAIYPLRISRKSTVIPGPFPRTRKAFVAPTLPEPNCRISIPFRKRPKRYAVGIDPIR